MPVLNDNKTITMSAKLVGKQSPFFKTEGEFILPIKQCLEGFCRKEPPSKPQLAVPSSSKEAFKYGQKIGSDKQIAICCLSAKNIQTLVLSQGEMEKQ